MKRKNKDGWYITCWTSLWNRHQWFYIFKPGNWYQLQQVHPYSATLTLFGFVFFFARDDK